MKTAVYNIEGKTTGREVSLAGEVFGIENPNEHVVYQDVKYILANRRQGTHKSKERGEVSGSNKKPYRQKGTGNARPGHKRSPLWRHGGRVFGPKPRNYSFKLNKKQRQLARKCALSFKAQDENAIKVIENFAFDKPKTKQFISILNNLELGGKSVLLVTEEVSKEVYLSGRNVPNAQVSTASDINTYDILNADILLMTEGAVNYINEQLAN